MQTDGGSEFQSFSSQLKSFGIQHRLTCPHTLEQNGLVERQHRQIVEIRLVLLAQTPLQLSYQSYAFETAIYSMNCLPTKALNRVSPVMKLYGKLPNYEFLKVFGCHCYPLLRLYNCHKLQFRSTPCVFLGYADKYRGYRCVDSNGMVYISRNVRFNELEFPFAQQLSSTPVAATTSPCSSSILPVFV